MKGIYMKIKMIQTIIIALALTPFAVKAQGNLVLNGGFDSNAD
jgi:hypothetical protein